MMLVKIFALVAVGYFVVMFMLGWFTNLYLRLSRANRFLGAAVFQLAGVGVAMSAWVGDRPGGNGTSRCGIRRRAAAMAFLRLASRRPSGRRTLTVCRSRSTSPWPRASSTAEREELWNTN
jgi:hypothetical protein